MNTFTVQLPAEGQTTAEKKYAEAIEKGVIKFLTSNDITYNLLPGRVIDITGNSFDNCKNTKAKLNEYLYKFYSIANKKGKDSTAKLQKAKISIIQTKKTGSTEQGQPSEIKEIQPSQATPQQNKEILDDQSPKGQEQPKAVPQLESRTSPESKTPPNPKTVTKRKATALASTTEKTDPRNILSTSNPTKKPKTTEPPPTTNKTDPRNIQSTSKPTAKTKTTAPLSTTDKTDPRNIPGTSYAANNPKTKSEEIKTKTEKPSPTPVRKDQLKPKQDELVYLEHAPNTSIITFIRKVSQDFPGLKQTTLFWKVTKTTHTHELIFTSEEAAATFRIMTRKTMAKTKNKINLLNDAELKLNELKSFVKEMK